MRKNNTTVAWQEKRRPITAPMGNSVIVHVAAIQSEIPMVWYKRKAM